jgi:glycosyltransferase involved in cell wall biosynthesis
MISAVILAKNEEKNIKGCLNSLKWCDEMVVIDDESEDRTSAIAKNLGAKVFTRPLNGNFSEQRNFGLQEAKGEWVLFVDADERVSEALWYEIMQQTNAPFSKHNGFFLKRRDIMWGRELVHGESGDIKLLRLAKKNSGEWKGAVHETWVIDGDKGLLNNPLTHYPHSTVEDFLKEINFYTDLRAKELYKKEHTVSGLSLLLFPIGKFFQNYFIKQGIRDGVPGLIFAIIMSFHSFLVRGKLWLMNVKKKAGNSPLLY